ncbi:MAG: choice-of-anchor Q domain-containing protein, partial [Phycisphaerae bacterium]
TIPDECDLADQTSTDCNTNAIPDDCEPDADCNENGLQDICDIAAGTSLDCNLNGILDQCEVLFVRADATGANNGTSWEDAYTDLQDALAVANSTCDTGAQIWVATGFYPPAPFGGDRRATFRLINGVTLYGGFAGHETSLSERDASQFVTVLTGDLNADDGPGFNNRADNVYHVVSSISADSTAGLDGFMIVGGHADGFGLDDRGGGLFNQLGSPSITNVIFLDNYAASDGGALYTNGATTLLNCAFFGNYAGYDGGAVTAVSGRPTFTNCVFDGNAAGHNGGALRHVAGNPLLTGCTLSANSAGVDGGGIYSGSVIGAGGRIPVRVSLVNTILWGNTADNGLNTSELAQIEASRPSINFCCVQGWTGLYGGAQNIGDDPFFVDSDGPDGVAGNTDDDLRLSQGSPCVNVGNNDVPSLPAVDLDGGPRIEHCTVDLGAYESAFFVDCDSNGLADACELVANPDDDCNGNLLLDACEPDCNGNGAPDDCDLANHVSEDCNFNSVPDDCEPDCDADGAPDACEIATGASRDCNTNTIPDECELATGTAEDCNANDMLDECDVTLRYATVSPLLSPIGTGFAYTHTVDSPPEAISDVEVVAFGRADLGASSEYLDVQINGTAVGSLFQTVGSDCPSTLDIDVLVVSGATYNELIAEGSLVVSVTASADVDPSGCPFTTSMKVAVQYDAHSELDCNENSIPDDCERDSDNDGVINECDGCPYDIVKVDPGICGCGVTDADIDHDGVAHCIDQCPGIDDNMDSDGDGTADCLEAVPAVSAWGLVAMSLLLLSCSKVRSLREAA